MNTLFKFQLGHEYATCAEGYDAIGRNYAFEYFSFLDEPGCIGMRYENLPQHRLAMYAKKPVRMLIGASAGKYALTFLFYDGEHGRAFFDIPNSDHGPFDILVNGEVAAHNVITRRGQEYVLTTVFESTSERIEVELRPAKGADFILNTLELEALDGGKLLPLFPNQPRDFVSDASALGDEPAIEPMDRIRELADFICSKQQKNGYIGDAWGGNPDGTENLSGVAQVLYASAFPVRALLAAYELTGEERYRDAALTAVDMIIDEQLPNGAFLDHLTGIPVANRSEEEVEHMVKYDRKPISDVGSVIQEICIASHYADGIRKERFINSVKAYSDGWASRSQTVNGAFTDGQGLGDTIYSVATATMITAHTLIYAVTGEEKYLKIAEDAGRYLLLDFAKDGSVYGRLCETYATTYPAELFHKYAFGHLFYLEEGLITLALHTKDEELRTRINKAITARAIGEEGFMKLIRSGDVWFPLRDNWTDAKQVGTVQTVTRVSRLVPDNKELREFEEGMLKMMCTPTPAKRLGIKYDRADVPKGISPMSTLAALSLESTGQAVLSLAEYLKPGIIYLAEDKYSL